MSSRSGSAWARILLAVVLATTSFAVEVHGQAARSLASVKKLYVEPFGAGKQDDLLRQSLLNHLRKSGMYQIVDTVSDADATLKGNGRIWVKGHFTINSRAPTANRQPVYAGFLSAEITSKDGEPLWSSLVTPSRFSWSNVVDDLADNLTGELLRASKDSTVAGTSSTAAVNSSAKQSLFQADLSGAGATFPAPLYRLWFHSFQQEHPEVHLTYQAVGSESGVEMLARRNVDFAASDVSPQEMSTVELHDKEFQRFAVVLGGVVPIYHLDGLTRDLNFTPGTLADIYLGKIKRWDDPEIRNSNKGTNLPDAPIVVIHRSDGSGTTHAWTDFLSITNAEWKDKMGTGTKLTWPVGQGAEGSEGVASTVEKTPNAIGYVEFVYAIQHQLGFGAVQNSSGKFIRASLESLAEAAKTAVVGPPSHATDSITNPPGKAAYPIASFTWLLLPERIADPAKKQALLGMIQWMLTSGQKECSALGYAPLPREVASRQSDLLDALQ